MIKEINNASINMKITVKKTLYIYIMEKIIVTCTIKTNGLNFNLMPTLCLNACFWSKGMSKSDRFISACYNKNNYNIF